MKDPFLILTIVAALGILAVFTRYAVTGEFSPTVATLLGAMFTGLLTVLKERRKKGGEDDADKE